MWGCVNPGQNFKINTLETDENVCKFHYPFRNQVKIMSTEKKITRNTKVLPVIATQQCINSSKSGSFRSTNSLAIRQLTFSLSALTGRM